MNVLTTIPFISTSKKQKKEKKTQFQEEKKTKSSYIALEKASCIKKEGQS